MVTVNDKLADARTLLVPMAREAAENLGPMAAVLLPTVEPMLHAQLDALLARPADQLDAWLAQAIGLLASLRSDDAPPLLLDADGEVDQVALAATLAHADEAHADEDAAAGAAVSPEADTAGA